METANFDKGLTLTINIKIAEWGLAPSKDPNMFTFNALINYNFETNLNTRYFKITFNPYFINK